MSSRRLSPLVIALLILAFFAVCFCFSWGFFSFLDSKLNSPEAEYYETVAEVQELLRTSPDHLPANAERLVAEGDAERIFEWVRDEIALMPSSHGDFRELTTFVRWGERGALRAGQGTFREKADILAGLLNQAGYEAEVVGPYRDRSLVTSERVMDAFFRDIEREASFDISDREAEKIAAKLSGKDNREGLDEPPGTGGIETEDQLQQAVDELAEKLLALESGSGDSRRYRVATNQGIPLVRVEIGGEDRYLNPNFVDADFAGVEVEEPLEAAPEAEGLLNIEARLEVLVSDRSSWRTLAEGSWTADELAGRQISVGAVAGMSASELSMMRLGDVDILSPYLMVKGADLEEEQSAELSVVGDPISVEGQLIDFDEETNQISRGGSVIHLDQSADPSKVASIDVEADGRSFPNIDLDVQILDGDDVPVLGLGGAQFFIEEEGKPVGARLMQNAGLNQRVLFLLDTSGSIPRSFRGQPMVDFSLGIMEQIQAEAPGAEAAIIRVDGGRYRQGLDPEELWTGDLEKLREQGESAVSRNGGSHLWTNLAHGAELEPTVIVFVNDGHDTGNDGEDVRNRVAMGPPAIIVGVGPVKEEELQDMADRSGGEYFEALEVSDIAPPVEAFLRNQEARPYRLRYSAFDDGPEERTVSLGIKGAHESTKATANYVAPETPTPLATLAGVRLHLKVGSVEVTRLLAGTDDEKVAADPPLSVRNDVLSTFLSPTTVFFEGDAPPLSVWLDEYAGSLRTQQNYVTAGVANDEEALFEAMEEGFQYLPPEAFLANPALPGALSAEARTFVQGMRVAIHRQRVEMETGFQHTSFDILPTARFATMRRAVYDGEDDGSSDYATTLQRTAWLALMEAGAFSALEAPVADGARSESTYNLLGDKELGYGEARRRRNVSHVFPDLDEETTAPWENLIDDWGRDWSLFVPADATPMAMWAVHSDTGEMYGILSDGTGGANAKIRGEETLREIDRFFRMMSLYTMPLNLSPAIGLLQHYFIMLAQLYAAVTVVLATMDASGLEDEIRAALASMVCNTFQSIMLVPFQAASSFLTVIDGLLAIGDKDAVPLPCSW